MIGPAQIELLEQGWSVERLEPWAHFIFKVGLDRLAISIVQLGLEALDLLDAEFVHLGVYLHVLFFGEDNFGVTCRQVSLQGNESLLPQVLPLGRNHVIVVNDHIIRGVAWHGCQHLRDLLLSHHF